jgi:hypothetical protein
MSFPFGDGRLFLRGKNGAGKSNAGDPASFLSTANTARSTPPVAGAS